MERTDAKLLGTILEEYIEERGLEDDFKSIDLRAVWNKVMGKRVANSKAGFFFKNGTDYITLSSSLIKNRLYFNLDGIIVSLNNALGKDIVKKIVLK